MALLSTRGSAALRNYGWGISASGNTIGLFFGGVNSYCGTCIKVTRINKCNAQIGSETSAGTSHNNSGSAGARIGCNGVYYGGVLCNCGSVGNPNNKVTRINKCGALVGSEGAVGTARGFLAGAAVGCNGMYFGGTTNGATIYNLATRINRCGALAGEASVTGATVKYLHAGAAVGCNAMFYAGVCEKNTVTRINKCGALVGSEGAVGTGRNGPGGAAVGCYGIFYAGENNTPYTNLSTKINKCGALVGSEASIGTARWRVAGAGVP